MSTILEKIKAIEDEVSNSINLHFNSGKKKSGPRFSSNNDFNLFWLLRWPEHKRTRQLLDILVCWRQNSPSCDGNWFNQKEAAAVLEKLDSRWDFLIRSSKDLSHQYLIELQVSKTGDARVGFVGFPSVGKSTLLSNLAGVYSEVAAYEFTTLTTVPGLISLTYFVRSLS